MNTANGNGKTKQQDTIKGNNSPYIVVYTSNGTIRHPNPNYIAPKRSILSKLFGTK